VEIKKQQTHLQQQYTFDYWIVQAKLKIKQKTVVYVNAEEELFEKYSSTFVDFSPVLQQQEGKKKSNDNKWMPMRRIMFIQTTKLEQILNDIEKQIKQQQQPQ